jgi:hypothetical protein
VEGYIRVLFRLDEVAEAGRAQVLPGTAAAPKQCLIRIIPIQINGRRFQFGAEPVLFFDFGNRGNFWPRRR